MVSSASPLPVIMYNVPSRTGVNMEWQTTVKIANEFENVIAIKEASGNMLQIMNVINNKPKDFILISGDDAITLPIITAGGDGVISVIGNGFPREFSSMVSPCIKSGFEEGKFSSL